jgi:hypothetical protein
MDYPFTHALNMKIRLALFALALLILPPLSQWIAEASDSPHSNLVGTSWLPSLLADLLIAALVYALDAHLRHRKHASLLHSQGNYVAWLAATGATLSVLLSYLNVFAVSWIAPQDSLLGGLLILLISGALLLPAVLVLRLWLASFGLRGFTRRLSIPVLSPEPAAYGLLLLALAGLFAGSVWTAPLWLLFWSAPLLLLLALQLLWHESTIFAGLAQGDWSRVLLTALSGCLLGALWLLIYRVSGGTFYLTLPLASLPLAGALFGWLCLQLGDVVAEAWRGKTRRDIVTKRKPFPIPVVVRKD